MNLKPPYAVYLGKRGKDISYREKIPDLYVLDMSKGFSDEDITDSILNEYLFGGLG